MANATYDVFVSYSRADTRHAADIDSVLRSKGLRPFFDRRSLAPGLSWVRALEQAIGAAKAAIVLIGPRGLGNTQQYERDLALIRQTRDPAFPVVPVLLPATTSDPPFDFLRVLAWIDFSHVAKVSDTPDELEHLLAAIHFGEAARGAAREAMPLPGSRCIPRRGLRVFLWPHWRRRSEELHWGADVQGPRTSIRGGRGPIRSGKSSLVHAGDRFKGRRRGSRHCATAYRVQGRPVATSSQSHVAAYRGGADSR